MAEDKFRVFEHCIPCQHVREYAHTVDHNLEDQLHLAVKQYVPLANPDPKDGDVTIIGGHAIGFGKECYEPLWEDLLDALGDLGVGVRAIWVADAANHGASYVFNEDKLGNEPSWTDHSRDLLYMVNHFRNDMKRPIIGVAHSMGSCNLVDLALMHPRLFSTLILLEPAITRVLSVTGNWLAPQASALRRDKWESRELARESMLTNPFYQRWDPRVLDRYIRYGLRNLPTRLYPEAIAPDSYHGVTLTTPRDQEVVSFMRPNLPTAAHPNPDMLPDRQVNPDVDPVATQVSPFYVPAPVMTFHLLPHLRPSVLWIFGTNATQLIEEKLAQTGIGVGGSGGASLGRVKHVQLEGSHLLPFEKVREAAVVAGEWIAKEVKRWKETEGEEQERWAKVPVSERQRMHKDALEILVKGPPTGKQGRL